MGHHAPPPPPLLPATKHKKHQHPHEKYKNFPELCAKSAKILHSFIQPGSDVLIPPEVIHAARGIAILRIFRVGLHFNGRGGKGVVMARLPDGSWSAPSALAVGGLGAGLTIGADVTQTVLILNTDAAVRGFTEDAFSLVGIVSVGPVGHAVEATASLNGPPIFSYSQTKGFYFGVSVEGTVIKPSNDTNIGFYGPISAGDILAVAVPQPQAAAMLYEILESPFVSGPVSLVSSIDGDNNEKRTESNQAMNRIYTQTPPMDLSNNPPTYTASVDLSSLSTTRTIENGRPLPTLPNNPSMDATTFCVAVYDYKGEEHGDLEFKAGDTIGVIQTKADGWLGELEKRVGYVPSNYVRLA
ncbi:UNVERIFIED_CONTAM: SH3 domain-containing YSC84-like protein 1, partial [Siphonaria sp. JEL0065]